MDLSRCRVGDWLMAGGGALMLVSGLLPWVKALGPGGLAKANAFDFTFTGALPWMLVVGTGVLALLVAGGVLPEHGLRWPAAFLFAGALSTGLILFRLLVNPIDGKEAFEDGGGSLTFGIGVYGALVAAAVATVGAGKTYTDKGGELRHLVSIDKLKELFGNPPRNDAGHHRSPS